MNSVSISLQGRNSENLKMSSSSVSVLVLLVLFVNNNVELRLFGLCVVYICMLLVVNKWVI